MRIKINVLLLLLLGIVSPCLWAVEQVRVLALFPDKALLSIDGKNQVLQKGQTSKEGVTLISADPQQAVVKFDQREQVLRLGSGVGGQYKKRSALEYRVVQNGYGAYVTGGFINGQSVTFLVDTGATGVAMNQYQAQKLGIQYRLSGTPTRVQTASGTASAWSVQLQKVRIGEIEVQNVAGVVVDGDSPKQVLLGMSFLNHLDIEHSGSVMLLKKKR